MARAGTWSPGIGKSVPFTVMPVPFVAVFVTFIALVVTVNLSKLLKLAVQGFSSKQAAV